MFFSYSIISYNYFVALTDGCLELQLRGKRDNVLTGIFENLMEDVSGKTVSFDEHTSSVIMQRYNYCKYSRIQSSWVAEQNLL